MINSRDSYTDFNPNRKESIEVPYGIGTIVESKDNPDVLARIIQYRITVEHHRQIINVGLNTNIYGDEDKIDCEITVEELEEKWKKPDRIIVGKLNPDNFIHIPEFSENMKKLELIGRERVIKDSASFNISEITNVLAELVSKVEGEKYVPIIYGNNNWKTLKYFAAVAEEYLADEFVAYSKYTSEDFGTYAFNLLKDNSFIDIYHSSKSQDDNYNKQVTFCRLLNKYGIECNSNIINNNDFSQFSYINDFIRYLFELQLANGGKHLTYEEMVVALNKFLELEKDKPKTKKLINSTSE